LRRADLRRGRPQLRLVDKYFTGTATTIEGVGLEQIAEETVRRHAAAYGDNPIYRKMLDVGGSTSCACAARNTPGRRNIAKLQHAPRGNIPEKYKEFAQSINDQSERMLTIRGLMELKKADDIASTRSSRQARSSSASPPAR
jgi:glutamate synthase (NADPH/NADH) large chain